jgi:hypothetical protein
VPNLLMLASGVGLVSATRRSLGTRVAADRSPLLRWSYLDRRHLELVFGRRLGRDRDRTFASYLGVCGTLALLFALRLYRELEKSPPGERSP